MKDGAIICNTGHFNVEIDIPALRALAVETREARQFVEEFTLADGRRLYLLAEGRLVNISAAEGHPAIVMDMSFANQALATEYAVAARRLARAQGLPGAARDRRGDRPPEARDDGRRDRHADRRSRRSTSPRGTRAPEPAAPAGAPRRRTVSRCSSLSGSCVSKPTASSSSTSASCRARRSRSSAERGRGRRGDPDDGRPRRARDRDRGRLRDRARGGSGRGSRRGRARAARVAPDGGEPRLGARRDARRSVGASTPARSIATRSSAAARCRRTPRRCSRRGRARSPTATPAGSRPAGTEAPSARCSQPGSGDVLAHVWVDETRPLLQGARLTAWELETAGIPHAVIADSAAASLHGRRRGRRRSSPAPTGSPPTATRPTRSAPTAWPCSPRYHGIPFYVVAPSSTVDHATRDAAREIPIEERDPGRGDRALRGAQPGLRRHARRR